ncbi:hypothetical protein NAT51_01575 [Flavobacterium amniphilum]|uniref:hypothetical protein n=1 Tax=Flavobacterium amniphilum TaxID=1834035 RepID=UPI00202A4B0C|nr:hypothetical protein [Flavobacterium amniphilum]MCL9804196.1 hypothetical protein [Flavobacterium amniphilum]
MSTEIKNTLFRFVTMRTPEVLEKDQVVKSFVNYPNLLSTEGSPLTNVFLEIAENVPSGKTKAKALADAANGFTQNAIKTKENLYLAEYVSKEFYDFAVWLTANRTRLKKTDVDIRITNADFPLESLTPIENPEILNTLWENLFYQIITFKSSYLRDAILSVLVANFFLRNYSTTASLTLEDVRKLAQARVIIPKVLFEKEDTSAKKEALKTALSNVPLNTKMLDKEMDLILCEDKIETYNSIIAELKQTEIQYRQLNKSQYDDARSTYDQEVANLYEEADFKEKTMTDPVTKFVRTIKEYTNLEIPPFEYERPKELAVYTDTINKTTASDLNSQITDTITSNGYETFGDVISHYQKLVKTATQAVFENTNLTQTITNVGDVFLPTANSSLGNIFTIGSTYATTNTKTQLTLLFDNAQQGFDVVSAQYKLIFPDNTIKTGTTYADAMISNKLSVKIFREGLNLFDVSNMSIEGKLMLHDGRTIAFAGEISITESPFTVGKIALTDSTIPTMMLRGKGTYQIKMIELDPEGNLPEDNQGSTQSTDGNVITYIPSGHGIKRLGIADYRKVEQEVCCYVPGEVSHIENVMASEYKEKATRRMRRTENTTTTSNEKEIEKLTDSTTTDRFEMNQEVSSVLTEDMHVGAQASFDSSWADGAYKLSVSGDFAYNTSSEESNNQAVTHAKDVTERALDRVVQKIKEERVSKIIEEFEENNKHGYDNRKNANHVSGVYRWVDKIYRNKVMNYGKRLMYEFMIPQPAMFHKLAQSEKKDATGFEKLIKPVDPRTFSNPLLAIPDFSKLTETNYTHWASLYNAAVEKYPTTIDVSKVKADFQWENDGRWTKISSLEIEIPENYKVDSLKGTIRLKNGSHSATWNSMGASIQIGTKIEYIGHQTEWKHIDFSTFDYNITKKLTMLLTGWDIGLFNYDFVAKCSLTKEAKQQWQIETFNTIIQAYEDKLAEYNAKMAEIKAMQQEKIRTNPMFFRQIENTVLRKNCIEYLASHEAVGDDTLKLLKFNTVKDFSIAYDDPKLEEYAAKVKFFEQAFEWSLMSYNFYPFYWASKEKWSELYNETESDDPIFRAFLQSGMARVIVTARPGFEEAVNWYMTTGQIWNGGQVPTIDDPLFVSIVDELRETEGEVEETWETRVPTSLTIIQAGSVGLEVVQALPCDEDCADYKLFDSDGQPVLDENGKQVSTNPLKLYNNVKLQGLDNTDDNENGDNPIIPNPGDNTPSGES